MSAPSMRRLLAPMAAVLLAACAAETSSPAVVDHLEVVSAPTSGTAGWPLDAFVVVRLVDDQGSSVIGAQVFWSAADGQGTITPIVGTTGVDGIAIATWKLGIDLESQAIHVSASGVPTLTVTATAGGFRAKAVAIGDRFGCGIDSVGDAWCWGDLFAYPESKAFGDRPTKVDSTHALVGIVAGTSHACGWNIAGAAWCWGQQVYVGQGVQSAAYTAPSLVAGGHTFSSLAAGDQVTCGLDAAGEGWCWGYSVSGNFGSNAAWNGTALVPTAIEQGGTSYTSITMGSDHACGLEADGTAWCWGKNFDGEVGDSAWNSPAVTPRQVSTALRFSEIAGGDRFTCAKPLTGGTWCWGFDYFGLSPTDLLLSPVRLTASSFRGIESVHTLGVGIRSGRAYFWGRVRADGYIPPELSSQTPMELPGPVTGLRAIAAGIGTICGMRSDDLVLCWGEVPGFTSEGQFDGIATIPVALKAP